MRRFIRPSTALAWLILLVIGGALPSASAQQARAITPPLIQLRAGPAAHPTFVAPPVQRPGSRPASAQFNVRYSGFTAEAQAAFQYAVNIWAAQITSPVPIEVDARWEPLDPGVLGQAGAVELWRNFGGNARPNVFYPVALANRIAGRDINPTESDIFASFSSNFSNWYFGTDGNTPAGQYDFVSVVLHELGHGLGFAGSMQVQESQAGWGFGTGFPAVYDLFSENGGGTNLIDTSAFPNPSAALAQQLTSDDIFWDGPNSRAAAGGSPPRLYAPPFWQQGSSYSHLDESTYGAGDPNSLMTPQIGQAEAIHNPGAITRGIFADMGWTIAFEVRARAFLPQVNR